MLEGGKAGQFGCINTYHGMPEQKMPKATHLRLYRDSKVEQSTRFSPACNQKYVPDLKLVLSKKG